MAQSSKSTTKATRIRERLLCVNGIRDLLFQMISLKMTMRKKKISKN